MVTVNVMGDKIGTKQLSKLQEMMQAHPMLVSLCGIAADATEANLSGLEMNADDAVILAAELPAKGALTSLDISNNMMATKEAGKALAEALASNSVLRELNLSGNAGFNGLDGPGFAQELATGVSANGALETITFGDEQAVTMKADMNEADFSNKGLGAPGAMIVAAFLPKCQ